MTRAQRPPQKSIAILACVASLVIACQSGPAPAPATAGPPTAAAAESGSPSSPPSSPGTSTAPGASDAPDGPPSSQSLIAADLASGAISLPESLRYRAWALFWDPRLPERYDGGGSVGEDQALFYEIAQLLPSLPSDQAVVLEPYLLRPTDPRSAFNVTQTATHSGVVLAAAVAAASPPPDPCALPNKWVSDAWSPNSSANTGLRVWACDTDQAAAQSDFDTVLNYGAALWPSMTAAVPSGMGLPAPDTTAKASDGTPANGGDGKIDVYLLQPGAPCRPRADVCRPIPGDAGAATTRGWPVACNVPGFPPKACSGYMLLPRTTVVDPQFAVTFEHEFFHVLQFAHNGLLSQSWYVEASAAWSEWEFVATSGLFPAAETNAAKDGVFRNFRRYQDHRESLLRFSASLTQTNAFQYEALGWPLFQSVEYGPDNVYETWSAIERAGSAAEVDSAVERTSHFTTRFRDFAVRNAQPAYVLEPPADGMPKDRWQTKPKLAQWPTKEHRPSVTVATLPPGDSDHVLLTAALNAHYKGLEVRDKSIRQITIDISGLTGAAHADVDVVGLVSPQTEDGDFTWRRFKGNGSTLTLCRDVADQDVSFIEVVISNHAFDHVGSGPDPAADLAGSYEIKATDKCVAPDHFSGTISGHNNVADWTGTVTFDRVLSGDPKYECNSTGGEQVTYCYKVVGGQVAWHAAGGSWVETLGTPDEGGSIELIVSDTRHPDHAGSYEILVSATANVFRTLADGSRIYPEFTVFAWTQVIDYPHWAPDWHLSGTEDHSGCGIDGCGTQIWSWDLTARFDP